MTYTTGTPATVRCPRKGANTGTGRSDEWWIQVEGDGTRRLVVPDRSVEVLGPADALPATVFALHWSRTGDLLGRQQLETTTATSGNSDRPKWTVRPPAGAVETIILASGFEMVTID